MARNSVQQTTEFRGICNYIKYNSMITEFSELTPNKFEILQEYEVPLSTEYGWIGVPWDTEFLQLL